MKKYTYRIKQKSVMNYTIEFRPAGLVGMFFGWTYLQRHSSLDEARANCKRQICADKAVITNRVVEVFCP